jgi:hypothetical protein
MCTALYCEDCVPVEMTVSATFLLKKTRGEGTNSIVKCDHHTVNEGAACRT